jgi:hypothetical protein
MAAACRPTRPGPWRWRRVTRRTRSSSSRWSASTASRARLRTRRQVGACRPRAAGSHSEDRGDEEAQAWGVRGPLVVVVMFRAQCFPSVFMYCWLLYIRVAWSAPLRANIMRRMCRCRCIQTLPLMNALVRSLNARSAPAYIGLGIPGHARVSLLAQFSFAKPSGCLESLPRRGAKDCPSMGQIAPMQLQVTKYGRIYVICCQDDMGRSVPLIITG